MAETLDDANTERWHGTMEILFIIVALLARRSLADAAHVRRLLDELRGKYDGACASSDRRVALELVAAALEREARDRPVGAVPAEVDAVAGTAEAVFALSAVLIHSDVLPRDDVRAAMDGLLKFNAQKPPGHPDARTYAARVIIAHLDDFEARKDGNPQPQFTLIDGGRGD